MDWIQSEAEELPRHCVGAWEDHCCPHQMNGAYASPAVRLGELGESGCLTRIWQLCYQGSQKEKRQETVDKRQRDYRKCRANLICKRMSV